MRDVACAAAANSTGVAEGRMSRSGRRSTPTPAQLRVWRDYIETAGALQRMLGSRLQAESGMSTGDYAVLLALSEAPGHSLRSSELAAAVGWERSRLSHHLGRMQRRALIDRESGRGVRVSATSAGLGLFRAGSVPHLRAIKSLFVDALTPEQLEALGAAAAALRVTEPNDTPGGVG